MEVSSVQVVPPYIAQSPIYSNVSNASSVVQTSQAVVNKTPLELIFSNPLSIYMIIGVVLIAISVLFVIIYLSNKKKKPSLLIVDKPKIVGDELLRLNSLNKVKNKYFGIGDVLRFIVNRETAVTVKLKNKFYDICLFTVSEPFFIFRVDSMKFWKFNTKMFYVSLPNIFVPKTVFVVCSDIFDIRGNNVYMPGRTGLFKRKGYAYNPTDNPSIEFLDYFGELLDKEEVDSGFYAQLMRNKIIDLDKIGSSYSYVQENSESKEVVDKSKK